jgi:nucleotide-binding universal stress UspA family protein
MNLILTPIDGSLPSYHALAHAASLASLLHCRLAVLLVRQLVVGRRDVLEVWSDAEVAEIRTLATDLIAKNGAPDHEFIETRARDVAYTIVETAIDRHADLIVMGASGKGGLKSFMLGSVSTEVLRKSACPVTIVR